MEKIEKLKKILISEKLDGYLIPKNDEFFGEYIPEYNDRLNFISDFTGSYGFALILRNKNYLFVDGRYTLQAKNQSGNNFKIVTFPNKMPKNIFKDKKFKIGYDPKLLTKNFFNFFFKKTNIKFLPLEKNLINKIWRRKKPIKVKNFYALPDNFSNQTYNSKIKKITYDLKKKNADYQFISASENCAWLLNIRGFDSEFSPLPNCYILIDRKENILFFSDPRKISIKFKKKFKKIKFIDIILMSKILSEISEKKFIIDANTCSIYFENLILANNKIIGYEDSIYLFKSIKTNNEIKNIKKAHISDGLALTKYLFWLKKNFFKKKITEISASKKLSSFREKNKDYLFPSFPTISGTGPNGAVIHYKASKKTNRQLKKGDIYLVDSGGQYKFGTTDVTRTISLNNSDNRIKNIFTRVLKGHIAVANFNLKKNTKGSQIDKEARKFLRKIDLDYAHGTGHGVGYFLNVHEGPQSISKNSKTNFLEGMIISNEPGYYEKNNFGIRIENLIYVKKTKNKKIFENLTLAPLEKELIDVNLLSAQEKNWINNYHKKVFKNLKNYMYKNDLLELRKACSAI
jgi:Xaa-Pro aminopeptidase